MALVMDGPATAAQIRDDQLQLMPVVDVAAEFGVSKWVIYRLIRAGELNPVYWGMSARKKTYIARREVERYRRTLARPKKKAEA